MITPTLICGMLTRRIELCSSRAFCARLCGVGARKIKNRFFFLCQFLCHLPENQLIILSLRVTRTLNGSSLFVLTHSLCRLLRPPAATTRPNKQKGNKTTHKYISKHHTTATLKKARLTKLNHKKSAAQKAILERRFTIGTSSISFHLSS